MKLSQAGIIILTVIVFTASGCGVVNRIRAKNELNEAARSYREGRFSEAQWHSERALQFDPDQKVAPSFIARSIHAQYKQGVDTPENKKKATDAIDAYKRILEKNPNDDEAYKAVAALYGMLGESDTQRQWITTRATDNNVDAKRRSEAYTFLASKDWECSFQVTESKANQKIVNKEGKNVVTWIKPKDTADFDRAQKCVAGGMENVDKAISLDPNNDKAWGYKTNLLLESKKLAEMDGKADQATAFSKQADEAQKRTRELAEQKKKEAEAKKTPTPPAS